MNGKQYKLSILPLFEDDLDEIVDYITVRLRNPNAAERLVDDVEAAIRKRLEMPERFESYPSTRDREHPYYTIQVRNFTVFYVERSFRVNAVTSGDPFPICSVDAFPRKSVAFAGENCFRQISC